jgi:hypothetical protein
MTSRGAVACLACDVYPIKIIVVISNHRVFAIAQACVLSDLKIPDVWFYSTGKYKLVFSSKRYEMV